MSASLVGSEMCIRDSTCSYDFGARLVGICQARSHVAFSHMHGHAHMLVIRTRIRHHHQARTNTQQTHASQSWPLEHRSRNVVTHCTHGPRGYHVGLDPPGRGALEPHQLGEGQPALQVGGVEAVVRSPSGRDSRA
eukprot:8660522-Alexandrium_andersonii.AAC.1